MKANDLRIVFACLRPSLKMTRQPRESKNKLIILWCALFYARARSLSFLIFPLRFIIIILVSENYRKWDEKNHHHVEMICLLFEIAGLVLKRLRIDNQS